MKKLNTLIAKSSNGTEIIVSLIPLNKMQNTRDGLKSIEVGKRVLLQSGIEVDLNLDGRTELDYSYPLHDGENKIEVTVYNQNDVSSNFKAKLTK